MSIPSPFEAGKNQREQNLKEQSAVPVRTSLPLQEAPKAAKADQLPVAKKKGKAYNLYIELEVMERVTALAKDCGVSVSSMVSALLKIALEKLEV